MKGVVFNELERMVVSLYGEDAWDGLIEKTPLKTTSGIFHPSQVYPDEDLLGLVVTASKVTGIEVPQLVQAFGKFLFPSLVKLAPAFVKPGMSAKDFLLTVDRVIHVEVYKLHPGVQLPSMAYEDPGPGRLVMVYKSPRHLCDLVVGLLEGVGEHFKEKIEQKQAQCTKTGHPACRFEMSFSPVA